MAAPLVTTGLPQDLAFYPCFGNPPIDNFLSDGIAFVDFQHGSNLNRGTTLATAVANVEELALRWGGPYLNAGPGVGPMLGKFREFQVGTVVNIISLPGPPSVSFLRVAVKPVPASTLNPNQPYGLLIVLPQVNTAGQIPNGAIIEIADYSGAVHEDSPIIIQGVVGAGGFLIDANFDAITITQPFGRVTLQFFTGEGSGQWNQVPRIGTLQGANSGTLQENAPAYGPASAQQRNVWPQGVTALFVDPVNGSDQNPGTSSGVGAIKTIAQLNSRLRNLDLEQGVQVNIASDIPAGDAALDLSTLRILNGGFLIFAGAQIVRSAPPNPLTGGTTAINPATQQRQIIEDTTNAGFGGNVAQRITDKTGANVGTGAWIVKAVGAHQADTSRPFTSSFTTGTLAVGDSYNITTGCQISIGDISVDQLSGFTFGVTFQDLTIACGVGLSRVAGGLFEFIRCGFTGFAANWGPVSAMQAEDCYFPSGFFAQCRELDILVLGGVLIANGFDTLDYLELGADVYVTGLGIRTSALRIKRMTIITGATGVAGAQFQDCTSAAGAIDVSNGYQEIGWNAPNNGGNGSSVALPWGNGNTGFGIVVRAGSTVAVSSAAGTQPSVTGTAGDFAFQQLGGTITATAQPYTVAGGYAAAAATTWANFVAAGTFNFGAHSPLTGANLVGGQ